jgi:glycosyltransferase involved in cell wall biosynthesis
MRIGIDVRKIKDFGIGVYIQNLVKNLLLLDKDNKYLLFFNPVDLDDFTFPRSQVEKVTNRSGKYSLSEHLTLSWQSRRKKVDLFFSPHYVMPIFLNCMKVVTIHDLIHLKFPEFLPRRGAHLYARLMFKQTVRAADRIIADSHHTKSDICRILKVDPQRIEVVYPALDEAFCASESGEEIKHFKEKWGVKKDYILYLGSEKPHKNLGNALLAYSKLAGRMDLNLVVVGANLKRNESLEQTLNSLRLKDRITILDFIPRRELPLLYAGAGLLVFPSLYEGFGFPVLEAFFCGTPVVASNSSSIPEVAGDAAFLVDPLNVDAIAEGILAVLNNTSLRRDLIEKGRRRAELFSWKATAEKTLRVFERVARGE